MRALTSIFFSIATVIRLSLICETTSFSKITRNACSACEMTKFSIRIVLHFVDIPAFMWALRLHLCSFLVPPNSYNFPPLIRRSVTDWRAGEWLIRGNKWVAREGEGVLDWERHECLPQNDVDETLRKKTVKCFYRLIFNRKQRERITEGAK